jgi:hypothetical protein
MTGVLHCIVWHTSLKTQAIAQKFADVLLSSITTDNIIFAVFSIDKNSSRQAGETILVLYLIDCFITLRMLSIVFQEDRRTVFIEQIYYFSVIETIKRK